MKIIPLDRKEYDYYVLHYRFQSDSHYVVTAEQTKDVMSVKYVRQDYAQPRTFENDDTLFQDYWDDPEAFAMQDDDGSLVAFIEFSGEEWNSRLRLTQLLVNEDRRGQGIGKKLIDFAKQTAKERDYRMIVLETQSNNTRAIDFYMSQGFVFCGSNIYFYSDCDIEDDEVMLELGYLLD